jgi:hypothetical protein
VFSQDETRLGLMTILRRVITLAGIKPIFKHQYNFKNFYLYGAVEPETGEDFYLEMPYLNGTCFQIFLDEFSKHFSDSFNCLLVDNGRFHVAKELVIPGNVCLIFQPPYSPELNPIERLWQYIKEQIALENFETLDELLNRVEEIILTLDKETVKSLTSYDYFITAVQNVKNLKNQKA